MPLTITTSTSTILITQESGQSAAEYVPQFKVSRGTTFSIASGEFMLLAGSKGLWVSTIQAL
jgi:hypothetical protein